MRNIPEFRSDQKCTFLAPIGLKFRDQAFLDLEIQKTHSVWPDFFETFFFWVFLTINPEINL